MSVIIPEGVAKVDFEYRLSASTKTFITSIGMGRTDPMIEPGTGFPNEMRDLWTADGAPGYSPECALGYTLEAVRCSIGTDTGVVTEEIFPNLGGSNTNSYLPPNCATLVQKVTSRGGKRGRGRMFLPAGLWLIESEVSALGMISSAQRGFIQDAVDFWLASLAADDYVPLLLHAPSTVTSVPPPPPPPPPTVITGLQVEALISTQRRRLR